MKSKTNYLPITSRIPNLLTTMIAACALSSGTAAAAALDTPNAPAHPFAEGAPPPGKVVSLNEADRLSYKAGPFPLESPAQEITLKDGAPDLPPLPPVFSLSGEWQLIYGEQAEPFTPGAWTNAIKAPVPGSVHTALFRANVIPDPYVGTNQEIAARWSKKTYYYKRVFARPPAGQDEMLVFDGICNRCTIWLNGEKLGDHEGMFDSVEFPVRDRLKDSNTLIVKLEPAIAWQKTVVFNNSYGWHYSKFPPLGIWQPVSIRGKPAVRMQSPFIATRDAQRGLMDLAVTLDGSAKGWAGKLSAVIVPDNFAGRPFHFEQSVVSPTAGKELHFRFTLPDPKLWWPVDMGDPNLYRLKLAFTPAGGGSPDVHDISFGVRTVEMAPVNGKVDPELFNWTFVINGKPMFVKGAGWCTMDAMMDFSRERYDRFLSLAADQHIQMLRAWGSGMVETEDFYDLCNRKGIMVMQEWPTAWNSHGPDPKQKLHYPFDELVDRAWNRNKTQTQPFALLERTVRYNVPRLRNHPSLVIYAGGNESNHPFGPAIDMMGRLNIELDGTREFHRGQPFGGSKHNYDVWWGGKHIDLMFTMHSIFYGEFGIASYPVYESVQRFLPDGEKNAWPPVKGSGFRYHTPVFDKADDFNRLTRMSRYFTEGATMERFIVGSQLAQAAGVRATLERMRSRWPQSTGALYYKLNDNCPAASWATVDWYGAPKIGHYLIQDSFAPLLAVALFPAASSYEKPLTMPVYLLDDADALKDAKWEVTVSAYCAELGQIKAKRFSGKGSINCVKLLGEFSMDASQTKSAPLFMVLDVKRNGTLIQRNYNFTNFENEKDCLFNLPRTTVAVKTDGNIVSVKNTGRLPAVGVNITRPGHLDSFTASDNFIWLDPGESQTIRISHPDGVAIDAWNLEGRQPQGAQEPSR
jgi:beta-mannosidase